jgi:hypothetical protein
MDNMYNEELGTINGKAVIISTDKGLSWKKAEERHIGAARWKSWGELDLIERKTIYVSSYGGFLCKLHHSNVW